MKRSLGKHYTLLTKEQQIKIIAKKLQRLRNTSFHIFRCILRIV